MVFEDSKYHGYIIRELSGKTIYVLDVQILELLRIIYRTFSNNGKKFDIGINKLIEIKNFFQEKLYETRNIKVKYIKTRYDDYLEAIDIISKNPRIFSRMGPRETVWPEIIDAMLAIKWKETRATLYTKDHALIQYGRKEGLDYKLIKA